VKPFIFEPSLCKRNCSVLVYHVILLPKRVYVNMTKGHYSKKDMVTNLTYLL